MDAKTAIDPRTGFVPRQNAPKAAVITSNEIESPLDAATLSRLEQMSREELVWLVRRCAPEKARVLLMGESEQAQAMLDALAIMALTSDDDKAVLVAIREWLDRKQGRAVMRAVVADANVGISQRLQEAIDRRRAKLAGKMIDVTPL